MTVDAANREEGVTKMKSMMDESAIKAHMEEKHKGQPLMTVAEVHAGIEQGLQAA
jgi:hypothetical protein